MDTIFGGKMRKKMSQNFFDLFVRAIEDFYSQFPLLDDTQLHSKIVSIYFRIFRKKHLARRNLEFFAQNSEEDQKILDLYSWCRDKRLSPEELKQQIFKESGFIQFFEEVCERYKHLYEIKDCESIFDIVSSFNDRDRKKFEILSRKIFQLESKYSKIETQKLIEIVRLRTSFDY
jgi:hypothetical protein